MEQEIWKDVIGHEGLYKVSNQGNVMSFRKNINGVNVGSKMCNGYMSVSFGRGKTALIHKVVAMAFLHKIDGKNQINHKNGKRDDNRVENLEWVNNSENNKHAFDVLKRKPTWLGRSGILFHETKKINQYTLDGVFIREWYNAREIHRNLGLSYKNISSVCKGKRNTCGGFKWEFKNA